MEGNTFENSPPPESKIPQVTGNNNNTIPSQSSNILQNDNSPLTTFAGEIKLHTANPNTILSRQLLQTYFDTFEYPFTRHHIDSFDQFLTQDLPALIKANNPILIVKFDEQKQKILYKTEIFVGGLNGDEIQIGTPTISLQQTKEVRLLFPNEARLRNLSYSSTVYANILVRVSIAGFEEPLEKAYTHMPLFQIPICLHSRFCVLHGKPKTFLQEAGECPQDPGGYFIVDGSEKVLITKQEQAFNTFYISQQSSDPKIATYGNINCLSPITRDVKMISFFWVRKTDTLQVTLPYVRKPIPIFVLFRALGYNSDEEILSLIYSDLKSNEAKQMMDLLHNSILEAHPFYDQFSAIQFIKAMTKGFSEEHVYDILYNKMFIHITDKIGGSKAHFLADCVRKFMRVHTGIDPKTDKDDTRNQRCLTTGFLIRMLFNNAYSTWIKATRFSIDKEYEYNKSEYQGQRFIDIFNEGNTQRIFNLQMISEGLNRGFKGRWVTGGAGGGQLGHSDEKTGVLQSLSRLSYLDFMSHLRRLNLNFDTSMKLTGPRQLHSSQYGYFCTNETPGGASIGITKNYSLMTLISLASNPDTLLSMLIQRGWVIPCIEVRNDIQQKGVPLFINNGLVGYTLYPFELTHALKLMKWTACLPPLSSVGFSIRNRKVFVNIDEGRPTRPLIHLGDISSFATIQKRLQTGKVWKELVTGTFPLTQEVDIVSTEIINPMKDIPLSTQNVKEDLKRCIEMLAPHAGVIEYIDPYEQNEAFIVNFPEHMNKESSHLEIHPCTIVSIVNGMIPFANFNQSVRNQLSCSQSKQGVSLYATNFQNRFDNSTNIMCYGEAPLVRTLHYDILGNGLMPYGQNVIMAIMPFHGFNRDDGIVFNYDSFQRGLFRNITQRSYTAFEEIDRVAQTKTYIANPLQVPSWTDLRPGLDYTKLDERGIIKVNEYVDENTVIVGEYIQDKGGKFKDASVTPQVWTSGRVESVVVTVNNVGLLQVKVRITHDRIPELGDKFSTRHGQKGTIGMLYRSHDLPRTKDGLVPDMLVNPHCIPSRMTIAQLMEMLFGKVCYENSMIGDATLFMSDKDAPEALGRVLERQFAMERHSNEILYDGESGMMMPTTIFMGPVFAMRLKHMVEDKWNARAEGRREQRTHQPTGGRGAQGGLRIGEMERDTLIAHGVSGFLRESLMERADKTQFKICNGCGTVPIYNDKQKLFVCSLCDGPVSHIGSTVQNMELLPTVQRSFATTSSVEMPYATKLLVDELQTYMNMGMRVLTASHLTRLKQPEDLEVPVSIDDVKRAISAPLPQRMFPDKRVPEYREAPKEEEVIEEDLVQLGVLQAKNDEKEGENDDLDIAEKEFEAEMRAFEASKAKPLQQPTNVQIQMLQGQTPMVGGFQQELQTQMPPSFQQPQVNIQIPQPQQNQFQPPQGGYFVQQPQQFQQQPNVNIQVSQPPQLPQVKQTQFYESPVGPTYPPTFYVDTSSTTMAQEGFMEDEMDAHRGFPVMGGTNRRNITQRARPMSPRRPPATVGGQSLHSNGKVKFTINKI
jgi:DNA-directed RNA polymerase II subunit RPB2